MAVTATEAYGSREQTTGANATATLVYHIRGTSSDSAALTKLDSTAPSTYTVNSRILVRKSREVSPVHISSDEDACIWLGTAQYETYSQTRPTALEVNESQYSFSTGGGTQHVTQSIATISATPVTGTAPDFKGAIGVSKDAVEGVDLTVPVYNFSERHIKANADIDDAYKAALFALTATVNAATFRGFAAKQVLFLGAAGESRNDDEWEIRFDFAASPNQTSIAVGDITVPAKAGWEYLWVLYSEVEDTVAKALVRQPIAAYVEQVYNTGDFDGLEI